MQTAKELISEVTTNKERVTALTAEAAEIVAIAKEKEKNLRTLYGEKILDLEIQRDRGLQEIKAKRKFDYTAKIEQVEATKQELDGLKRILTILRLPRTDLPRGQSLEIGGTNEIGGLAYTESYIINEEFLKIKLFIVSSSKANQAGRSLWALCGLGKCYFPGGLLKLPPKTHVPFPTQQDQYQVECVLHEGVGPAELRAWLESNRETLRAQLLGVYAAVEAEYLGVLRNFKPEDFSPLMSMVCKGCAYFVTTLDDATPDKCPRCSQAMTAWPEPEKVWPNR